MNNALLEIHDLDVFFPVREGGLQRTVHHVKAVNGVHVTVKRGETLGIVGESGCGKSTLARTIIGLQKPTFGEIQFGGKNIQNYNQRQMHQLRRDIQMVFQDPFTSLNPRMKVGEIIAAPLRAYKVTPHIKKRVLELMEMVGLDPEYYDRLPHEFSGGQRQRIGIARAIALEPKLIICDEPVSALDVSIQAQIINLLKDLQKELQLTYIFISHDLSVMKHMADQIAVMYLGKIMEVASKEQFYTHAKHPYSNALLSAIPYSDPKIEKERERIVLSGDLPSPINPPTGCVFHTRCPRAQDYCKTIIPLMEWNEDRRQAVACFYPVLENEKTNFCS
ncbi:putative D,D-dipeptide transport ATP-binding protein DdpF [compost metagenome]